MRRSFFLSSSVLLLLAGCPSSSANDGGTDAPAVMDGGADGGGSDGGGSDGGGSDGGGSDGGGSDGGGSTARGDCASTTDCPAGGMCIELVPGGYRVCQVPPVEATSCEAGRSDECCNGSECATGDCFLGPIRRFCGGAKRLPFNECMTDQCASDGDCTDAICAPRGTFAPVAVCVAGACHTDADCTAEAGGSCVVVTEPCCGIRAGLFCSYPSDGCQSNADCTSGYCAISGDRARCMSGGPICPG
jgi:hypothetical protein